nr:G patch domain and ankyrin repeat-containing protein 1 homolog isoform X1 [Dermacentor andersoni]
MMSVFKQVAFVRGADKAHAVLAPHSQSSHTAQLLSGDAARKFYDDTVSLPSTSVAVVEPSTSTCAGRSHGRKTLHFQPVKPIKVSEYFIAAQSSDILKLKRCLGSGIDVNVTDIFGWTALMCACFEGAVASVQYLLKNGASKYLTNAQGKTAIELAAQRGHVEVVEMLCKPEKLAKAKIILSTERQADTSRRHPEQLCRVCGSYFTSSEMNTHETSIVHQFNLRRDSAPGVTHYGISEDNAGFQMLLGMGWNREKGFGLREQGRKFPVKTVFKRDRSGLGVEASTPRVTHFAPHDRAAVANVRGKDSREGTAQSLKSKRKEQESRSRRMKQMEIEFRRSFH